MAVKKSKNETILVPRHKVFNFGLGCVAMTDRHDETAYRLLDDNDPHYTAVGHVSSIWALLESGLDMIIGDLARTDTQAAACLTAQMVGPGPRIRAMIALARLRGISDELIGDLNEFSRTCTELGARRNRVVHDALFIGRKTGNIYQGRTTADRRLDYGFFPVSIDEIKKTAAELVLAVATLSELAERVLREIRRKYEK